jgi:hypothetical protein
MCPVRYVTYVSVRSLDYLAWHCIDRAWRITAKSFHVERTYEAAAS